MNRDQMSLSPPTIAQRVSLNQFSQTVPGEKQDSDWHLFHLGGKRRPCTRKFWLQRT